MILSEMFLSHAQLELDESQGLEVMYYCYGQSYEHSTMVMMIKYIVIFVDFEEKEMVFMMVILDYDVILREENSKTVSP